MMKRFSFIVFVFIVLLLLLEITESQTVVTECDRSAAQEECIARGCDCWLESNNVRHKDWLSACIEELCSYNQICSNYGCTFEECIEGNCDLSIEYVSVCEEYCNGNCGEMETLYGDIWTIRSTNGFTPNNVLLPDLSDIYLQLTIEFDIEFTDISTSPYNEFGGFLIGSGTQREFASAPEPLTSVIDFIGERSRDDYGFRFYGDPIAARRFNGNEFNFDYSLISYNPSGHWKLIITFDKSNNSNKCSFYFNNYLIYNDFSISYLDTNTKLSFWAYGQERSGYVTFQVSNLRTSYDTI